MCIVDDEVEESFEVPESLLCCSTRTSTEQAPNLGCTLHHLRKLGQTAAAHLSTPTTMFKTAATKIAHNSTIPALGGNQDLRPLQDLITAEKAVLISYVLWSMDGDQR